MAMSPFGEICLERGNSMVRTRRTLTAATLLATLVLVPSLASARQAAAPKSHATTHAATQATSASLVVRLWHGLRNLWGAEGVSIDPNGAHISGTTRQTPGGPSGAGMLIDPNG